MRCTSNDLDQFALHDTLVEEVMQRGLDLCLRLSDANVLDTCPANPHGCGMCAADMWLTFEHCVLRAATIYEGPSYDPVAQTASYSPRPIPAEERLQALREALYILSANKQADEGAKRSFLFEMSTKGGGFLVVEFLADGIRFEWDEYAGLAWFEECRHVQAPDSE